MNSVRRFADLTANETCDIWLTPQKAGRQLEDYHKASSLTLVIQLKSLTWTRKGRIKHS
ncbi:hypothetical protein BVRB_9g203830 isoform B [Beta vulgaris subsp. vulgaris]|nr:hypothetical protein BVRB_9g203830 isoform B [Beta vulgaris subsp. vulgaris]